MHDRPLEDWEYPDPDEADDDGSSVQVSCPACGELVYEDAERCPHCGEYIVFSHDHFGTWPRPLVILGLLGVAAVILVLACQF